MWDAAAAAAAAAAWGEDACRVLAPFLGRPLPPTTVQSSPESIDIILVAATTPIGKDE